MKQVFVQVLNIHILSNYMKHLNQKDVFLWFLNSMNSMILLIYYDDRFYLFSMDGSDLCFEIEKRALAGFVYSEAVAR